MDNVTLPPTLSITDLMKDEIELIHLLNKKYDNLSDKEKDMICTSDSYYTVDENSLCLINNTKNLFIQWEFRSNKNLEAVMFLLALMKIRREK